VDRVVVPPVGMGATEAGADAVTAAGAATGRAPLLQVERLSKRFPVAGRRGSWLHAVDDLSFHIRAGESFGLVGESGCGKSTLVRLLARLLDPSAGRIVFEGRDLAEFGSAGFARRPERALIQMVFQDPTDSLNPRFTARDTIREPCQLLTGMDGAAADARVDEVAAQVGLPLELLSRFPHQLSGGQKARVGIARALAPRPRLLILDEPTAALDVSVQAVVLQLLDRLRRELGLTTLFVSHDLNVVRLLTDRVAVMYLGRIAEMGDSAQVFAAPAHPYTQALLSAIPGHGPRIRLAGEVSSPIDPPSQVCRFASRCPQVHDRCSREAPVLQPPPGVGQGTGAEVAPSQLAACHVARFGVRWPVPVLVAD
jgi:oligopeptide/dipeptide ABC transporter ATP-binding protein